MSGELREAFEDFERAGRETREMIEVTDRFMHGGHDASAYRTLAEARAMAYTFAVAPLMDPPRVHAQTSWHYSVFSLGQNCPDFRYGITLLDGRRRYRLTGRLGEQRLGLVQVHNHVMGHPDATEIGNYDLGGFANAEGSFDITVGGDAVEGIRLDPSSSLNFVIIRRIMATICDDPGELVFVPDARQAEPPDRGEGMPERLHRAADLLRYFIREWAVGVYDMCINAAGGKNSILYVPGKTISTSLLASPSTTYAFAVYDVQPGEALILDWQPTEAAYWSVQLADVWSNSFDFSNHQTDINMADAVLDMDGRFRAVVCESDPGVPNWLDNRGTDEGELVYRCYHGRSDTGPPTITKVQLDDLRDHLPGSTPRVSADERRDALERRRRNYRKAFGD